MKINDLLNQLKYYITPNKETMRQEILSNVYKEQSKKKHALLKVLCSSAAIVLILAGVGLYLLGYFTFDPSYNITGDVATLSPIVYVAPKHSGTTNSSIKVVTKESMSIKEVSKCISVTPEASFSIKKKGINRFELSFDESLNSNTSYTISSSVEGKAIYRWSLQTEAIFKIDNAYPVDTQEVDINTGIEITFSESSVNGFEDHFTIDPQVNGTFKHNGRTWIFLPSEPLQPYTVYTVTVSGEIANTKEQTLGKDYTFSFTTGASENKWAYVENRTFDIADTFAANTVPYVSVYAEGMSSATADITVYKLPGTETYLNVHEKYNRNFIISTSIEQDIKTAQYPVQSQFSVSAIPDPENDRLYYFNYPKEMEVGYYVAQIEWNGIKLYQLLQINDLTVFAAAHDGSYVIWVNNSQTALPVSNAVIKIGQQSVKTNENGIATFKNNNEDESDGAFISITSETLLPYILYAQNSTDQTHESISNYYTYLYTNSTIYHTSDTVKVWGSVLKRNTGAKAPKVALYASWNDTEYSVSLNAKGTFELEIPIKAYKLNQSGELSLRINGHDCYSKYLTIEDYTLPVYSLSVQTDKNAYFASENAELSVDATYFDGTPVGNLSVSDNDQIYLMTDNYGKAQHSKIIDVDTDFFEYTLNSCDPQTKWQYFETDSSVGSTAFAETPVLVFNNNEYLDAKIQKNGTGYTLDIKTSKISLDKINGLSHSEFLGLYQDIPQNYFVTDAVNKKIKLEVHEITYDRNKINSYYDPIQKKIQFEYEYIPKDSVLKSDTFTTKDGVATLQDYAIPASEGTRYLKLSMKDTAGKDCFVTIYIDHQVSEGWDQYEFAGINSTALQDEEIQLNVYDPATKQKLNGSFIYLATGDDYFSVGTSENGAAEFVFEKKCLPDVTLFGAYYDGKFLHPITQHNVSANIEEKKLNIKLTTDKKQYAPGETVKLEVVTTDFQGKPVSAAFNVNVMDKALLTLVDNSSDILEELYLPRAPFDIYTSLPTLLYGEGGGGGEAQRTDFEDTPAFICGHTGASGKTTVSFKLPDSLTTWAISTRALTQEVCAGDSQIEIKSTKDMFVSAQVPKTVKSSDDIVIPYRCDGAVLSSDSTVNTTITLSSSDKKVLATQTQQHNATQVQYFNLGKQIEGNYLIQIETTYQKHKDSIQLPISVVKSEVEINALSSSTVDSEGALELILTDSHYSHYAELLNKMLLGGSTRIDQTIAQQYALTMVPATYTKENWGFLNDYCIGGGYAPYVENGESDLFLTARIASLFSEQIDKEYVLWYFDEILRNKNSTFEDVLCALWGKAALHQALEKDLIYYYAEGNELTTEQQLYFALAYAYSGNHTTANEIYSKHIQPKLIRNGDKAYLEHKDPVVRDQMNSMLSLLTSRISSKDAKDILSYLQANDSETTLLGLEIVAYLLDYTPCLEGENSAKITFADGSELVVNYPRFAPYRLKIEAEKSNGIKVNSLQGDTVVYSYGTINGDTIQKSGKKLGAIACFIAPTYNLGDALPIYLSINTGIIKGNQINIVLPNAVRYLNKFEALSENVYVSTSNNPNVLTVHFADTGMVDITLHCKASLPGNFVIEPMLCIEDNSLSYYATDAAPITINPSIAEVPLYNGETGKEVIE